MSSDTKSEEVTVGFNQRVNRVESGHIHGNGLCPPTGRLFVTAPDKRPEETSPYRFW